MRGSDRRTVDLRNISGRSFVRQRLFDALFGDASKDSHAPTGRKCVEIPERDIIFAKPRLNSSATPRANVFKNGECASSLPEIRMVPIGPTAADFCCIVGDVLPATILSKTSNMTKIASIASVRFQACPSIMHVIIS